MESCNSLSVGEGGFALDCGKPGWPLRRWLKEVTIAFWLGTPQVPTERQVPSVRVGERILLIEKVNFHLKIIQLGICRRPQVYMNVKRTTHKPHSDKINTAVTFKWAQKEISPQTALTNKGFPQWVYWVSIRSVFLLTPCGVCQGLAHPSAKPCCLFQRTGLEYGASPPERIFSRRENTCWGSSIVFTGRKNNAGLMASIWSFKVLFDSMCVSPPLVME